MPKSLEHQVPNMCRALHAKFLQTIVFTTLVSHSLDCFDIWGVFVNGFWEVLGMCWGGAGEVLGTCLGDFWWG